MTTIDIDAIRQREQAATPGPWSAGEPTEVESRVEMYDLPIHSPSTDAENPDTPDDVALIRYYAAGFQYPHGDAKVDAEFIAHARQDIPALCDEVEELRDEVTLTRAELEKVRGQLTAANHHADKAAKRLDGLRDYFLGALDEGDVLSAEELRNASIDLAEALADLGHPVAEEVAR